MSDSAPETPPPANRDLRIRTQVAIERVGATRLRSAASRVLSTTAMALTRSRRPDVVIGPAHPRDGHLEYFSSQRIENIRFFRRATSNSACSFPQQHGLRVTRHRDHSTAARANPNRPNTRPTAWVRPSPEAHREFQADRSDVGVPSPVLGLDEAGQPACMGRRRRDCSTTLASTPGTPQGSSHLRALKLERAEDRALERLFRHAKAVLRTRLDVFPQTDQLRVVVSGDDFGGAPNGSTGPMTSIDRLIGNLDEGLAGVEAR